MPRPSTPSSLAAFVAVVIAADPAFAYPVHRRFFEAVYSKPTSCRLCHADEGGSERNRYGNDWHAKGDDLDAFRRVEALDSDGDGATNRAEIDAGSNPGDAASTPESPGKRWNEVGSVAIPSEQLRLVMGNVDRIEAVEPVLSGADVTAIEKGAGSALGSYDRYPTLYFGVEGTERTVVALFSHFRVEARGGWFSLLTAIDREGRVRKIALFHADDDEGSAYMPYLRCLEGHGRADLPSPGAGDCPKVPGRARSLDGIQLSVRKALGTVFAVLGGAALGAPEAQASASKPAPTSAQVAPTASASATLEFDRPAANASAPVYSPAVVGSMVVGALVAWLAAIALSVRAVLRNATPGATSLRLAGLSPSLRLVIGLVLFSFLLVQGVAATDAWVQTNVVHASALEYFQRLSWARMLGTTHAHLFGFGVMYGVLGLCVAASSASERVKCAIVATALWSGIFEVVAWWGMKRFSARFEWLMFATGAAAGAATVAAMVVVTRSLISRAVDSADKPI